ncbi:hypothetical protein ACFY8B_18625 [Streptomyces sp. NPDC012751]|uniref:AraC-like ligand-binding domain-containing protein n=1 Tax=Streptomyces sp. NPDC012751 TaxID=3364846 RepID=UPI0036B98713
MIRVSDPEIFAFGVTGSGSHVIEQNRHRAAVRPGELLFFESSRPFETHADGECILIQFPRTLLPLPDRHVTRLICRALPGDRGMGRLSQPSSPTWRKTARAARRVTPRDSAPWAWTWSPPHWRTSWSARTTCPPTPVNASATTSTE